MILAISGYAGVGKDAIADYLCSQTTHTWRRLAFADPLKRIAERICPEYAISVAHLGPDEAKRIHRSYLQQLGTVLREELHSLTFVQTMDSACYIATATANVVIPDMRYRNEFDWVSVWGDGVTLRLDRPGVGPANDHDSELELVNVHHHEHVTNDGTLADLHRQIDAIVEFHKELLLP